MWRLWLVLGAIVWLATIIASGMMNFIAGQQLGRTALEGLVFGVLGAGADAWKAFGPIFIVTLWRARQRLATSIAAVVWTACFLFAISAALGLVAENREARTGSREMMQTAYLAAERELAEHEQRRDAVAERRSVREIEQAIAAVLARPVPDRGTIGSLSGACSRDTPRTREACAEIAELRVALARAGERQQLQARIDAQKAKLEVLRDKGARLSADPQARLIHRLTFGLVATADVSLAVVLLMGMFVELISAFAPVVLTEFARSQRRDHDVAACRGQPREAAERPDMTEHVYEYLAARVVPDVAGIVQRDAIANDYAEWCRQTGRLALSRDVFLATLDAICREQLGEQVQVGEDGYVGFKLGAGAPSLADR